MREVYGLYSYISKLLGIRWAGVEDRRPKSETRLAKVVSID